MSVYLDTPDLQLVPLSDQATLVKSSAGVRVVYDVPTAQLRELATSARTLGAERFVRAVLDRAPREGARVVAQLESAGILRRRVDEEAAAVQRVHRPTALIDMSDLGFLRGRVVLLANGALGQELARALARRGVTVDTTIIPAGEEAEVTQAIRGALTERPAQYVLTALERLPLAVYRWVQEALLGQATLQLPVTWNGTHVEVGPVVLSTSGAEALVRRAIDPTDLHSWPLAQLRAAERCTLPAATVDDHSLRLIDRAAERLVDALHRPLGGSLFGRVFAVHEAPELDASVRFCGFDAVTSDDEARLLGAIDLGEGLRSALASAAELRAAIQRGSAAVIRGAFDGRFAEAVHRALDHTPDWPAYEDLLTPGMHRAHALRRADEMPGELLYCDAVLRTTRARDLLGELTGEDNHGGTQLSANWFMPGDFTAPHSDAHEQRSVAFVWHLTKAWTEAWGGHFYWSRTGSALPADFNNLVLFRVDHDSHHLVGPVSPAARGKRLAVGGWASRATPRVSEDDGARWRALAPRVAVTTEEG